MMADLQGAFINLAKSVEEDPPELEVLILHKLYNHQKNTFQNIHFFLEF